jgi:hypothetical protein
MQYPHRRNSDGSVDSICPRCIATIASSTCEADLKRFEACHVCEPWRLAYFEAATPRISWFPRTPRHNHASA